MRNVLRPLPLALALLLTACATVPVPTAHPPSVTPPSTQVHDVAGGRMSGATAPAPAVWQRLRDSFAMADCDADPAVDTWAHRYTRSPQQFEGQVRSILPRLAYVQERAAQHGVP